MNHVYGTGRDLERTIITHLFAISPNSSGSTFLQHALATSRATWNLPREGQAVHGFAEPATWRGAPWHRVPLSAAGPAGAGVRPGLPPEQFRRGRWSRWLMRHALRAVLPPEVCRHLDKDDPARHEALRDALTRRCRPSRRSLPLGHHRCRGRATWTCRACWTAWMRTGSGPTDRTGRWATPCSFSIGERLRYAAAGQGAVSRPAAREGSACGSTGVYDVAV